MNDPMGRLPSEKGVKMRGKKIEGVQYIRASDVAELLSLNGVLPNAERAIRRSIQ